MVIFSIRFVLAMVDFIWILCYHKAAGRCLRGWAFSQWLYGAGSGDFERVCTLPATCYLFANARSFSTSSSSVLHSCAISKMRSRSAACACWTSSSAVFISISSHPFVLPWLLWTQQHAGRLMHFPCGVFRGDFLQPAARQAFRS